MSHQLPKRYKESSNLWRADRPADVWLESLTHGGRMSSVCLTRAWIPSRTWFAAIVGLVVALLANAARGRTPFDVDDADGSVWCRLEYVNFWASHAALQAPLVTTGDAAGLGRLGAPQTQRLLGPGDLPSSVYPAFRFTLGGWLYEDLLGAELSIFATSLRATSFSAVGSASTGPLLAIPFADVTSGTPHESSFVVAQPGVSSGEVWMNDVAEFDGIDLNGLLNLDELILNPRTSLMVMGGMRALGFRERFKLSSGTNLLSGASLTHNDVFMTNDSFVGFNLGLRGRFRLRRWTFEATASTAIGGSYAIMYIGAQDGMALAYPRVQTVPGAGLFAQPTNIGRSYHRAFSVVPAGQLRVGYDLTSRVRLVLGYEAFYWTRMLRAPNQVDRQINASQIVGPLIGPGRPAPVGSFTNFLAQGFTAGVQFNY